jgi:sugar/nucleoside kinase (ribokinase family)
MKINEKESKEIKFQNRETKLLITLGSQGSKYLEKVYPVGNVDVHDVCGAGDTFLAALVARWLETKDITIAIKTANNCAALSVTKLGCYTVKRSEYENLCV